jgi:hypothetical protein
MYPVRDITIKLTLKKERQNQAAQERQNQAAQAAFFAEARVVVPHGFLLILFTLDMAV